MERKPTEMEALVAKVLEEYRALEPQHSDYINAARAAIRAMRKPTVNVIDAGEVAYIEAVDEFTINGPGLVIGKSEDDSCLMRGWEAMIDAASPE